MLRYLVIQRKHTPRHKGQRYCSAASIHPLVHKSSHPSVHSPTHPPIHLSTYPPIHPSTHPSIRPPIHQATHPPIAKYGRRPEDGPVCGRMRTAARAGTFAMMMIISYCYQYDYHYLYHSRFLRTYRGHLWFHMCCYSFVAHCLESRIFASTLVINKTSQSYRGCVFQR